MSVTASPATLARTYEALRAGAVGALATGVPRGLAVLRGAGMVAWMAACPPDRTVIVRGRPVVPVMGPHPDIGRELVGVLAEMALAPRTRTEVTS
ncbi:MAG: hypothetical protein Q8M74_01980 [Chloroflexota bacterium]|nr:hypothetical protein [Chloroflexota bacterium]